MNIPLKSIIMLVASLTYAWLPVQALAQPEGPSAGEALEIMQQVDTRPMPDDQQLTMTMKLMNRQGKTLERTLRVKKQGESKSFLRFTAPADVENTAFLNISRESGDDEMYLYMPALNRIRRIASSTKHQNFMGSDFTYDDMGERDIHDYTYSLLSRDAMLDGYHTYVITGNAKKPAETGYSRLKFWIRKDHYLPVKIEYYDRSDDLLKIQTNGEFQQIENYRIATRIEMRNVQTDHKTILTMEDIEVDIGLPEMTWTKRNLRR